MIHESSHSNLRDLLIRVRAGDAEAAAEFVQRYAPEIRTEVRRHLRAGRIRRLVDSEDVCQSVLASILLRLGADQFVIDEPQQLARLLLKVARNKVNGQIRHHYAARRDVRQTEPLSGNGHTLMDTESPSAGLIHGELIARIRKQLSPDELQIARMRKDGRTWAEIAAALDGTPEGIRKQFERAFLAAAGAAGALEEDIPENL